MLKKILVAVALITHGLSSEYVLELTGNNQSVSFKYEQGKFIVETRSGDDSSQYRSSTTHRIPPGFNPDTYMKINEDVASSVRSHFPDDEEKQAAAATFHYVKHGKREGRGYLNLPADFNPQNYLTLHSGVKQVAEVLYPNDESKQHEYARLHYADQGKNMNLPYC